MAIDFSDGYFSTSCAISTRPPDNLTISSVASDETIGVFINNHICWPTQLLRLISFSVATSQHYTVFVHIKTVRLLELVRCTSCSMSYSVIHFVLCPFRYGCNEANERSSDLATWENMTKNRVAEILNDPMVSLTITTNMIDVNLTVSDCKSEIQSQSISESCCTLSNFMMFQKKSIGHDQT